MATPPSTFTYFSKREQFLQTQERQPSEALRRANQIEKELDYHDSDHSFAHGVSTTHQAGLTRHRSIGRLGFDHERGHKYTEESRERHCRRRRTSHDEKLPNPRKFLIDVEETKRLILAQEDTDGDFQITVQDTGPKHFTLGSANSQGFRKYDIRGTYMLSNLLQELALASDYERKFIVLDEERLNENPVERMSRLIKYHFWDGLTRRIDAEGLELICNDPKNRQEDQRSRIYVPYHDSFALRYYTKIAGSRPHLNIEIVRLPEIVTPQYVKSLNKHPGILSLALRCQQDTIRGIPFVVPGGRFNEMYGWDSFFEAMGLLVDGRIELARGMVDNFAYQLEHYGKILNANRSYYLTRSQPPFLTEMILEVYKHLMTLRTHQWTISERKVWLTQSFRAAVKELLSVWLSAPRLDPEVGLSKFHPEGIGMPPETESTHFNHILEPHAMKMGVDIETYGAMYAADEVKNPELDRYFVHDRAVRESGHDTTYRFEKRCANLATVDLNSLVFKYEVDIARVLAEEFGGSFKLRCRRGPDDIYLNGFLKWLEDLKTKGVKKMIGREGGWNTIWAKGILVFDEAVDNEIRDKIDSLLAESGQNLDPRPAPVTEANDVNNILPTLKHPPLDPEIDTNLPTYKVDSDESNPYFTIRLPATLFVSLADRTRTLVNRYLWNPQARMYFDYDCNLEEQSVYESVTTLFTLWAGLASEEQAAVMIPRALSLFEVVGGLVCGTEESRGRVGIERPNRQWDYPYGWAPHQMLAWGGLTRYGYVEEARRCAYRWLFTITKSFVDFNGVVPEKFDVVGMTHKVNVEYGNVGADFKFVVREGFGWMNASFEVGLTYLNRTMIRALGALTHPDRLFSPIGGIMPITGPPAWYMYNYGYNNVTTSRRDSIGTGRSKSPQIFRGRRNSSAGRRINGEDPLAVTVNRESLLKNMDRSVGVESPVQMSETECADKHDQDIKEEKVEELTKTAEESAGLEKKEDQKTVGEADKEENLEAVEAIVEKSASIVSASDDIGKEKRRNEKKEDISKKGWGKWLSAFVGPSSTSNLGKRDSIGRIGLRNTLTPVPTTRSGVDGKEKRRGFRE